MDNIQRLKKRLIQLEETGGGYYIAQGRILKKYLELKRIMHHGNQEAYFEIKSFVDAVVEEEIAKEKKFFESVDKDLLEESELDRIPDAELTAQQAIDKKHREEKKERLMAMLAQRKAEREFIIDEILRKTFDAQNVQELGIEQKKLKSQYGKKGQDHKTSEDEKNPKDKNFSQKDPYSLSIKAERNNAELSKPSLSPEKVRLEPLSREDQRYAELR